MTHTFARVALACLVSLTLAATARAQTAPPASPEASKAGPKQRTKVDKPDVERPRPDVNAAAQKARR